jgi:peptidoglycan L-alanyl-D-glutamate endopeptidase CwlK
MLKNDKTGNLHDSVMGYGGKGTMGETPEQRRLYASVAQKSLVDLAQNTSSYSDFIKQFRGEHDGGYFKKVAATMQEKYGITPEQLYEQLKTSKVAESGAGEASLTDKFTGLGPVASPESAAASSKPGETTSASSEAFKKESFKGENLATGVNSDLVKVAQAAAKSNPDLFGMPSPEDAARYDLAGVKPGMRTTAEQEEMIKKGWSKTMKSKHLEGRAMDLWPINPKTGKLDPTYEEGYEAINKAVKAAAKEAKVPVEWGGDWKKFKDRPHFQLADEHKGGTAFSPESTRYFPKINSGSSMGFAMGGTKGTSDSPVISDKGAPDKTADYVPKGAPMGAAMGGFGEVSLPGKIENADPKLTSQEWLDKPPPAPPPAEKKDATNVNVNTPPVQTASAQHGDYGLAVINSRFFA